MLQPSIVRVLIIAAGFESGWGVGVLRRRLLSLPRLNLDCGSESGGGRLGAAQGSESGCRPTLLLSRAAQHGRDLDALLEAARRSSRQQVGCRQLSTDRPWDNSCATGS